MRSSIPDSKLATARATPRPRADAVVRRGCRRPRSLRLVSLVLLAACSAAPGTYTAWSAMEYRPSVALSNVEVYEVRYDSIGDRLSAPREMPPHDTIGIVVQEPKVLDHFDRKEDLFQYNPKVVKSLRRRAWELGGDAVLLGTPKIGRRGLDQMVRDFLAHESMQGDTTGIAPIERMTRNPWITHVAFVLRSRNDRAAHRSGGRR